MKIISNLCCINQKQKTLISFITYVITLKLNNCIHITFLLKGYHIAYKVTSLNLTSVNTMGRPLNIKHPLNKF